MTDIPGLIFRWLHVIPAIVMVGGVIFMRCCLVNSNATESGTSLFDAQEQTRKRWGRLVMLSTLLILGSGLYNAAMKAIGFELSMVYNVLLMLKIVLALTIFFLVATLSGRSDRAKQFRQREAHWLNIVIVLMLAVVMIAGYMKFESAGFDKKVKDQDQQAQILPS